MSFQQLNKDELAAVAEFFVKEVVAADPEKGPSKKELIAALARDDDGADPVSWEDYNEIYLAEKAPREASAKQTEAAQRGTLANDNSDMVLVKYERKNPTYQVGKYTFTTKHPFSAVAQEDAEFLVKNFKGFRFATPNEVSDYYDLA